MLVNYAITVSRGSVVCIVTSYGLDDRGVPGGPELMLVNYAITVSRSSVVCIVTSYGLDDRGAVV
jgi:hypothetical protein